METKEQLIRIVSQVGNGAHIFAPKEWINEKVLIIRLEKKTIKEQVLEKIYPHLDKIIAVFLFQFGLGIASSCQLLTTLCQ